MKRRLLLGIFAAPLLANAHGSAAPAAGGHRRPSAERYEWGQAGEARRATQQVRVRMSDTMRFTPDRIVVRRGDTVSFVVLNAGRLMHEFVIGTLPALQAHADAMKRHPGMEHDEPYMAHVSPGRTARIRWTFNRAGEFHAGCLIPGHWDAGMKATITVKES